jgi:hypothetical protein
VDQSVHQDRLECISSVAEPGVARGALLTGVVTAIGASATAASRGRRRLLARNFVDAALSGASGRLVNRLHRCSRTILVNIVACGALAHSPSSTDQLFSR